MALITPAARSRFAYLFGPSSALPAKPILPAKAKTQSRPIATRSAGIKPAATRPVDFGHLLKASRARGVEMLAPAVPQPRPRTLGERHRALLRARGEALPEPVDALPEQPRRRKNATASLGERVAALHKQMGRI